MLLQVIKHMIYKKLGSVSSELKKQEVRMSSKKQISLIENMLICVNLLKTKDFLCSGHMASYGIKF